MERPSETQISKALLSSTLPGAIAVGAVVAFFYLFVTGFGPDHVMSPLAWLKSTWNHETDFEHGFLVPLISIGLIIWQWPRLKQAAHQGSWLGLAVAIVGAGFFVLAHRTGQARLAVGGLPMILWGSAWFLWGWQVAKLTFFPLFVFWLAIPVPQFQQATSILQVLSTKLAAIGCGWFGVAVESRGAYIYSLNDSWDPLEINEYCGGIRSLMALVLIASVWAYIAKMSLWKKAVLCVSAVPLAIIGNMFRLTSIFVIGEYGDPKFAAGTWHDWSGLIIFYPISLALLLFVHSLLEGGFKSLKRPRMTRREVGTAQLEAKG
ncbi:exosortase/archaeosortase family protein [Haloferula helveola]